MTTTLDVYQEFQRYLDFLNLKEESKYRYLQIADKFLTEQRGQFTREAVMAFLAGYADRSSNYRRWMTYPLKSLFNMRRVQWPFRSTELPRTTRPYRPFFTYEQFTSLLTKARQSKLLYTLMRVDAATGMRRVELTWLNEIDYERPRLAVKIAKSTRGRVVELDPDTCNALDSYIASRNSKDGALFVGKNGRRILKQTITDMFAKLRKDAGIEMPRAGWHAIRRGLATWLFKAGWREKELQEFIGWESPAMPATYIQLAGSEIQKKVAATHPFFKGNGD